MNLDQLDQLQVLLIAPIRHRVLCLGAKLFVKHGVDRDLTCLHFGD